MRCGFWDTNVENTHNLQAHSLQVESSDAANQLLMWQTVSKGAMVQWWSCADQTRGFISKWPQCHGNKAQRRATAQRSYTLPLNPPQVAHSSKQPRMEKSVSTTNPSHPVSALPLPSLGPLFSQYIWPQKLHLYSLTKYGKPTNHPVCWKANNKFHISKSSWKFISRPTHFSLTKSMLSIWKSYTGASGKFLTTRIGRHRGRATQKSITTGFPWHNTFVPNKDWNSSWAKFKVFSSPFSPAV